MKGERSAHLRERVRGLAALREAVPGHFTLSPPRVPASGEQFGFSPPRSVAGVLVVLAILAAIGWPLPLFASLLGNGLLDEGLLGLVFGLFAGGFLVAWSIPVVGIAIVLLGMLFGRERVIVAPGRLYLRVELFGAGFGLWADLDRLDRPRWVEPPKKSGTSWRGGHVAFDVDGRESHFGCRLTRAEAERLIARVDSILGRAGLARGEGAMPLTPSRFAATVADAPAATVAASSSGSAPSFAPGLDEDPEDDDRVSLTLLVVANLVPLAGVLLFGWTVGDVMLVYWAESAIIGVFNLAKMLKVGGWFGLPMGIFFLVHYGGFMAGHLVFLYAFFMQGLAESADPTLGELFADFGYLWPALVALTVSHGVSFLRNFLGRREYEDRTLQQQMHAPYARIVIMHVTIIAGGILTLVLENATPALVLLVALKIVTDVHAHRRAHRGDEKDASQSKPAN